MYLKAILATATLACSTLSIADNYPSRPITFVIPSAPGGSIDSLTRSLAEDMSKRMGQAIIVENKAGAAGMLAAQTVARAKPDGYTVLVTHSAPLTNAPFLYAKMPYEARRDFALVTQLWVGPHVLAVSKDVPAKNIKEFLAWAAQNKGKVSYGSYGIGSFPHLAGAYMSQSRGLDMTHIAYKAEAPMVQDLVGGQVAWAAATLGTLAPHLASGRVRALAVLGDHRNKDLPNVPTMAEAGLADPEYKSRGWGGMLVPAGTPAPVLARLEKEARAAIQSLPMKARLQFFAMEPIGNSAAEFRRDYDASLPVIERAIKISGAKVD
ncbi:ABC transporter substrate-binding protein [Cupriavidus sp. SK-4]|uniref:Bug family tripartite tricarboxylate transporter substrate binding protein n=1 Tax=Cupriavidus sp. SK-4 TaxID=574750 RepID=UPI000452A45F|nr:tripartite tricarboxylate transporter substrate binding protein [Cupriavidus sp. SK-4]EYS87473.1 ABC transporter substrate-binding protein [Cupriavidus sp. SK-4]